MRGVPGALIAATLFAALPASAADPTIDSVTPTRSGDLVAATVHTSNLPGERVSASLKSGLPAAIEMRLETFDGKNHRVAENHLFYRIVWDLWDEVLRAESDEAFRRTGPDVGTPIITYDPPNGNSLFGPVISSVPEDDDALRLYDALRTMVDLESFSELKRSKRPPLDLPVFAA